jgi:dienelactone hydrolase
MAGSSERRRLRWLLPVLAAATVLLGACGDDSSDDGSSVSGSATSWDLGTVTLADGAPSRLWGVIAAPDEAGPHPVVVVLHGRHPVCSVDSDYGTWPCQEDSEIPNHEGFAYLVEALATRGMIAVAPGVNVQHTFGAGEPLPTTRTAELVQRTVDALAAGDLGVPANRVDLERLAVVGHSVGASEATVLATGSTAFEPPISGIVMLQPGLDDPASRPVADVPAVVVVGECDGDTGVSGAIAVSDALLAERAAPIALVGLERTTHNATNSGLRPDAFPTPAPACTDPGPMDPEEQRTLLAEIVPELVLAVLGEGGEGWAGAVFDEPEPPAGVQLGVVLGGQDPAPVPGDDDEDLERLELDGLTATFCPLGYFTPFVEPGRDACHRPELTVLAGFPQSVALSWDAPGASLSVALDAPAGSVLRLRGFPDVADDRLGDGPLRLRLSDGAGWSHDVEWPVPESVVEPVDPAEELGWDRMVHAFLIWRTATVELPVAVETITLEVLGPDAGAFHLVSLGLDPS